MTTSTIKNDQLTKKVTVGLPNSQSVQVSADYIPCVKVTVNTNGGMGGGSRDVFCKVLEDLGSRLVVENVITGKKETLFTVWCSYMYETTLLKQFTNVNWGESANVRYIEQAHDVEFLITRIYDSRASELLSPHVVSTENYQA